MRIAWATPINLRSAIGRVSADVTRVLAARGHEVAIIATETEADLPPPHATPAPIIHWREAEPERLALDHDVLIAQVGDHFGFHGGLFPLLGRLPTLGVFHDFYLYDLFAGWVADAGGADAERAGRHDHEVTQVYGPAARAAARAARAGELDLGAIAERLPMTEWLARRCEGAVAHAAFYLDRLRAACPGPVVQAHMPVTGRGVPPLPPRGGDRVVLLTVGVMNPNKCVDRVIAAIGRSPALKQRLDYQLVGPISPTEAERLRALAAEVGFERLEIVGAVDDAELDRRLAGADIISCLRRPVLEGASGSAIEALLAGRPAIVADAGFYRELHDEIVLKVGAEIPLEALTAHLERLAADEPLRRRLGEAGRAWAERRFDLDAYASVLEAAAAATVRAAPLLDVGRKLGRELGSLGLSPSDPAIGRIAQELSRLLPAR